MRGDEAAREKLLQDSAEQYQATLEFDAENVDAHFGLQQVYASLGDEESSAFHRARHQEYKLDDNARDVAVVAARRRYPAANRAAEPVVVYDLQRSATP